MDSRNDSKEGSNPSLLHSSSQSTAPRAPEALQQIFNTALVRTQPSLSAEEISRELMKSVASPAFRAILGAVHRLSVDEGIDERVAAEQVISTFRKIDRLWGEYLTREGMEAVLRLKS